ncbi:MAG TPA: GH25 family lysozyme, partial [Verrucomicrobiae bacterium]|nr:GH25 family lysozyme [Verrucomicrobiae bacterium]
MKIPLQITLHLAAIGLLGTSTIQQAMAQRPIGVDVSHYQGSINWSSVKGAGYSFAWAKATEGTYGEDDTFVNNENNGKGAGVYIGAYHFARPDLTSP